MKRGYAILISLAATLATSAIGCKTEAPVLSTRSVVDSASVLPAAEPGSAGDWRARRLDSESGVGSDVTGTADSAGATSPIVPLWARSAGDCPCFSELRSVAVDSAGSAYAVGDIRGSGSITLGNGVKALAQSDGGDGLLVKYNSEGKVAWAQSGKKSAGQSHFAAIAVDRQGNVYVAGTLGGSSYDFGGNVRIAGDPDSSLMVLVKYGADGRARWARTSYGGKGPASFHSVAVDTNGDIYAAGSFTGEGKSVRFSEIGPGFAGTQAFATGTCGVIAKYNSAGTAQWATAISGGYGRCELFSIAVDRARNVYVAGSIEGNRTYTFGNGILLRGASESSSVVIAKYNSSGRALWARGLEGPAADSSGFSSLCIDGNGRVYAGGYITGTERFAFGKEISAEGGSDARNGVLVAYETNGDPLWARSVADGSGPSPMQSIAVDEKYIYAALLAGSTAEHGGTYDFGNGVVTRLSENSGDGGVVLKYDLSGTLLQVLVPPTAGLRGEPISIALDPFGNLYLAGGVIGKLVYSFGNNVEARTTSEQDNLLIVKYRLTKDAGK